VGVRDSGAAEKGKTAKKALPIPQKKGGQAAFMFGRDKKVLQACKTRMYLLRSGCARELHCFVSKRK